MSLLKWLLDKKTAPRGHPARQFASEDPTASDSARPFNAVSTALEAWDRGDNEKAERAFKNAIAEYRRHEPDGVDFALGRYAAFLRDMDRNNEADGLLEEAIGLGTDIPAIWGDYVDIRFARGDLEVFWAAVERMAKNDSMSVVPDCAAMLLHYARKADRNGSTALAEAIARRVYELARSSTAVEEQWSAAGDLGHILERSDRVAEALEIWEQEFASGSRDPKTADRLSMNLEKRKEPARAIEVVKKALARQLPANVEERLRKRMARCEAKLTGKKKRVRVEAFSVRKGEDVLRLSFQTRVRPPVKEMEILGTVARCYGVAKGVGSIADIDLATGEMLRQVSDLPKFSEVCFPTPEAGIGIQRTGVVGKGGTHLSFLNESGAPMSTESVPDATSQVAFDSGLWYVGCRDGKLYVFDTAGSVRWIWETPGSASHDGDVYSRPCPYYVAAARGMVVVASMENIFAIDSTGRVRWKVRLPDEATTEYSYTVPLHGGLDVGEAYSKLGIDHGATHDETKRAYRGLARSTHPDHNLGDGKATDRFREIQTAYERLIAQPAEDSPRLTATVTVSGMGPVASFVAAVDDGVVIGSSHGSVFLYDWNGGHRDARKFGDGFVQAVLRPNGTLAAAWCDGMLSILSDSDVVKAIEVERPPRQLTLFEDNLLLADQNRAELMDTNGSTLWVCEFSKQITAIAGVGERVVCAAGVLAAFQRVES